MEKTYDVTITATATVENEKTLEWLRDRLYVQVTRYGNIDTDSVHVELQEAE